MACQPPTAPPFLHLESLKLQGAVHAHAGRIAWPPLGRRAPASRIPRQGRWRPARSTSTGPSRPPGASFVSRRSDRISIAYVQSPGRKRSRAERGQQQAAARGAAQPGGRAAAHARGASEKGGKGAMPKRLVKRARAAPRVWAGARRRAQLCNEGNVTRRRGAYSSPPWGMHAPQNVGV